MGRTGDERRETRQLSIGRVPDSSRYYFSEANQRAVITFHANHTQEVPGEWRGTWAVVDTKTVMVKTNRPGDSIFTFSRSRRAVMEESHDGNSVWRLKEN